MLKLVFVMGQYQDLSHYFCQIYIYLYCANILNYSWRSMIGSFATTTLRKSVLLFSYMQLTISLLAFLSYENYTIFISISWLQYRIWCKAIFEINAILPFVRNLSIASKYLFMSFSVKPIVRPLSKSVKAIPDATIQMVCIVLSVPKPDVRFFYWIH